MKQKKLAGHYAFINTSHLLLFIFSAVIWSWLLSTAFPENVQTLAFLFSLIYARVLVTLHYLLNQVYDDATVPNLVVTYFFVSALLTVASTIRGPIADGEVPVIRILFIGPSLYADSTPSLLFASVFPFYGAITLICSIFTSAIFELLYSSLYSHLPKNLKKKLQKIDRTVDSSAANTSDNFFFFNERKGALAIFGLLGIYAVLYFLLLIF